MLNKKWFRELAGVMSFLFGFGIPSAFALSIFQHKVPQQNIATWGMIVLLDGVGFLLSYKLYKESRLITVANLGKKKAQWPLLQFGWLLAATLIFTAILKEGNTFAWRWVETASLIGCLLAAYFWYNGEAQKGLYMYMAATYIAFVPQLYDYAVQPQPETWWLWAGSIAGSIFSILSNDKGARGLKNCLVPWLVIPLNLGAFIIVMR
jgi:hypothetical protein